jgi:hypothetical protein
MATGPPSTDGRPPVWALLRRYAVACLAAAVVLSGVSVGFFRSDPWLMGALIGLAPIAGPIAVIDARTRIIPAPLAYTAAALGLVVFASAALSTGEWGVLGRAIGAGVGAGIAYFVLWWLTPTGMGDVRLAAALAIYAGWAGWWPAVAGVLVLPFVLPLPYALYRLARGATARSGIALGPWLVTGTYLALILAR